MRNHDLDQEPVNYRIKVHLFCTMLSPAFANFGLRKTAEDNIAEFSKEAVKTVEYNFYVDDCFKSVKFSIHTVNLAGAGVFCVKWFANKS